MRTFSGWVYVAFARRRVLPEDHRLAAHRPVCTNLALDALNNGYLAAPAQGC